MAAHRIIVFGLVVFGWTISVNGSEEEEARLWLEKYDVEAAKLFYQSNVVHWNYLTNLTDHNSNLTIVSDAKIAKFSQEKAALGNSFDKTAIDDPEIKRQLEMIGKVGIKLNGSDQMELSEIKNAMMGNYGKASVCSLNKATMEHDCSTKYSLTDLTNMLETSTDYDMLEYLWKGWRDASGRPIRDNFVDYVALSNKGAKADKFKDTGDFWKSAYEDPKFEEDLARLWEQILPLYEQLHAYVRRQLMKKYPGRFQSAGIPAHILGNMWAQNWANIYNYTAPFPHKRTIDITHEMQRQNYTVLQIFEIADNLFKSLGMMGVNQGIFDKLRHAWPGKTRFARKSPEENFCWQGYGYGALRAP